MRENQPPGDQPLDRSFAILETVVTANRPLSITEVAGKLDLPAPTVHRLVAQLLDRDLLKRELDSKRVLAGPRLVNLGASILGSIMLADHSHTILLNLATRLGEHCHIGIVAEGEVLYVDTARAARPIGLQFQPGRRAPLHCTSIGKLYLSLLPVPDFERWLASAPLPSFTVKTLVQPHALAAEVAVVRHRGWSESHEEFVDGVVGCAVPIRKFDRFVAGLGIAAPAVRLDAVRLNDVLPELRHAAEAISLWIQQGL